MFGDGGVSVLNRWHDEICISFQSPLTNVDTLDDPLFDITYGAREDGQSVDNETLPPLPYAMVVTISAEDTPGVYNNIRQRYQTLQPVEVRQEVRIQSGTGRP
ncbi:hypothetical protein ACL58G_22125 [Massilia sp. GER05]|uniref:hypothetical protein n=1 Tax=Massilia sp. GER05 TaxID=3394605 RepID=UPI003F867389